ncbi:hypothetical protein BASA50_000759 [Batrachochytrium salamandrivorans]|uniref:Rapamycin-insensitive companion of mTOR domain-containing protein n=1 Tax=Batrachochytrium salamandrivorans TaxID=1357716 RepID=A0ABQ8ETH9_9FUNG|nr:hypothetical protein BASA50_000759 [Batrachochytrium salamandrivorans]KAH9246956.1 hypothetical protein BASA81_015469 [Batrachochytrium salamandrivorans]KAH9275851.1 hypothetical protein BASA83_001656 [Batrachochytrium salamandrivorans]
MDPYHAQIHVAVTQLLHVAYDSEVPAQTRMDSITKALGIFDLVKRCTLVTDTPAPLLSSEPILQKLRLCLGDPIKDIRVATYKILRALVSADTVKTFFHRHHLDLFIIRTLIRDARYDSEREQAIRFIRAFLDETDGSQLIPMSIVRSLVAIAEQIDDRFRNVCLETICEIAVRNPELACHSGGTKVMLSALLDGPLELMDPIISSFLFLLDSPKSRSFIRAHVELEMVISQFSDAYTIKSGYSIEKLIGCAAIIRKILFTWTGLVYFCIDGLRPIRSIVDALGLPNDDTRKALLGLFFDLFHVPRTSVKKLNEGSSEGPAVETIHLVSHFRAILLMVFINAGLIEALIELTQDENKSISTSSITLLSCILETCSTKLPVKFSSRVQSLPSLFKLACNFNDEGQRHLATSRLAQISGISGNQIAAKSHPAMESSFTENQRFGSIKAHVGLQVDELQLKTLLNDSEVIGMKDCSKWNWDVIEDIVSGPLLNPKRFDDLTRNSKFAARLIAYYRPSSRQFCDLPKNSSKIFKIGIELFRNLASSSEGARILAESRLLIEIADQLKQLYVQGHGAIPKDNVFLRQHYDETMSSKYFEIIKAFSHSIHGIRLLEQSNIYNTYYQLADLRGREDMSEAILASMDYSADGHSRIILIKALTAGSKSLRLAATVYLDQLARVYKESFHDWGVPYLMTQLSDPVPEIVSTAVYILQRHCCRNKNITAFIRTKPDIQQLSIIGNTLLIQSLSISAGFKYLLDAGYLETEMSYWFNLGNLQYVTHAELSISEGLAKGLPKSPFDSLDKDLVVGLDGYLPVHLYGELAKTAEGIDYLKTTGHIAHYIEQLKCHHDMVDQPSRVAELKAAIWALASIGSSTSGCSLLVEAGVVELIMTILKSSAVITVRGTCFYAFCVISQFSSGMGFMDDLGWSGESICVPNEPEKILCLPEWTFSGSWPAQQRLTFRPSPFKLDSLDDEILKCIGNLSNHILATSASKQLAVIRQQHPHYFVKPELCVQAWRICTTYHYRVATRRYIQELFERLIFDAHALEVVDSMAGLQLLCAIDEEASARLNENAFENSLSLLPKDLDRKGSATPNGGNKLTLQADRIIRGF